MKNNWWGILYIISSLLLIFAMIPIFVSADEANYIQVEHETAGIGYTTLDDTNVYGQTFQVDNTCYLTSLEGWINIEGENNFSLISYVYNTDSGLPDGSPIATGQTIHIIYDWDEEKHWYSVDFDPGVLLTTGTTYAFTLQSDESLRWYYSATSTYGAGTKFRQLPTQLIQGSYDYGFRILGYEAENTKVTTLEPIQENNKVTLRAQITNFSNDTCERWFKWGESTGEYTNEAQIGVAYQGNTNTYFYELEIYNFPVAEDIYVSAYIYNDVEGWIAGNEVIFNYAGDDTEPIFKTLPATDIQYSTARLQMNLSDLGSETDIDLFIVYDDDTDLSDGTEVQVGDDTTLYKDYYTDLSGLVEGKKYYYVAKTEGVLTGELYGEILTFTTWISGRPGFINWLGSIFDKYGLESAGFWLFTAVLMGLIWIFPQIRERAWLGVVIDLVVLGFMIASSALSMWIVMLLALGAGVTAVGFVVRHRQA